MTINYPSSDKLWPCYSSYIAHYIDYSNVLGLKDISLAGSIYSTCLAGPASVSIDASAVDFGVDSGSCFFSSSGMGAFGSGPQKWTGSWIIKFLVPTDLTFPLE